MKHREDAAAGLQSFMLCPVFFAQLRQQMVLFDREPEAIEELPLPEVPQEKLLPGYHTSLFLS